MFERRHVFGLGLGLLGCGATTDPGLRPGVPTRSAPRRIHVAGDSTAARFEPTDPRVGWGAVLEAQLQGVVVNDAARSGRSSKSFLEEGHWATLLEQIQEGDLVLIQFGHNDEKPDQARATDAATTFRDFLRRYVADSRAHGGVPILMTPVARRRFQGGKVVQSHGAFPDATRAVASEVAAPLLDMTQETSSLLERLGDEPSKQLFAPEDNTHFSVLGARTVAQLVVRSLKQLGFELSGER